jgi:hypothetical protein
MRRARTHLLPGLVLRHDVVDVGEHLVVEVVIRRDIIAHEIFYSFFRHLQAG